MVARGIDDLGGVGIDSVYIIVGKARTSEPRGNLTEYFREDAVDPEVRGRAKTLRASSLV